MNIADGEFFTQVIFSPLHELRMEIGKRIKELRKFLELTQQELADRLGVSRRAIQEWEAGRRTPSEPVLRHIEQTFSVNPEWLREGKGEMFKHEPHERKLEEILNEFSEEEIELTLLALSVIRKLEREKGVKLSPKQRLKLARVLVELLEEDESTQAFESKVRRKAEKLIEAIVE